MTKEQLEKKIREQLEVVYRQMKHCEHDIRIPKLKKREEEFFSNETSLHKEALRQIDDFLVFNYKAWDDMVRAKKEDFVDNFNNLEEFFDFTKTILDNMVEYEKLRNEIFK